MDFFLPDELEEPVELELLDFPDLLEALLDLPDLLAVPDLLEEPDLLEVLVFPDLLEDLPLFFSAAAA